MRYTKKPVEVEALKYQAELGNNRVFNWLAQQGANIDNLVFHDRGITIETLGGNMLVSDGDYIIIGVAGEIYPCKPDIFEETFEEVGRVPQSVDEECAQILQNGTETHYTNATCRGSYALGTACGHCERCDQDPLNPKNKRT